MPDPKLQSEAETKLAAFMQRENLPRAEALADLQAWAEDPANSFEERSRVYRILEGCEPRRFGEQSRRLEDSGAKLSALMARGKMDRRSALEFLRVWVSNSGHTIDARTRALRVLADVEPLLYADQSRQFEADQVQSEAQAASARARAWAEVIVATK